MLDTAKIKRKEIICLKEPEYCDIADVQAELKYYFYKAVNSDDNKIYIIKAQTAIGKTHLYLNYLKTADKPCIIAVPTNKLKNEVYEECVKSGINAMETPSIYEIKDSIPQEIYTHIDYLYNTGNHRKVMEYIKSKSDTVSALSKFVRTTENVKQFKGHIITTHHKVLYASYEWLKNYNIIIDEDILKTIIKN